MANIGINTMPVQPQHNHHNHHNHHRPWWNWWSRPQPIIYPPVYDPYLYPSTVVHLTWKQSLVFFLIFIVIIGIIGVVSYLIPNNNNNVEPNDEMTNNNGMINEKMKDWDELKNMWTFWAFIANSLLFIGIVIAFYQYRKHFDRKFIIGYTTAIFCLLGLFIYGGYTVIK